MKQYRQGDLLFIKVGKVFGKLKQSNVIQEGELTGHKHSLIGGNIYEDEQGNIWVHSENGKVTHEEHDTIDLENGYYEVRRQRELSGEIVD